MKQALSRRLRAQLAALFLLLAVAGAGLALRRPAEPARPRFRPVVVRKAGGLPPGRKHVHRIARPAATAPNS